MIVNYLLKKKNTKNGIEDLRIRQRVVKNVNYSLGHLQVIHYYAIEKAKGIFIHYTMNFYIHF